MPAKFLLSGALPGALLLARFRLQPCFLIGSCSLRATCGLLRNSALMRCFNFLALAFASLLCICFGRVPAEGYTREQLQPLTNLRQQHRRTIDGRLCAAAFVQDRSGGIRVPLRAGAMSGISSPSVCVIHARLQASVHRLRGCSESCRRVRERMVLCGGAGTKHEDRRNPYINPSFGFMSFAQMLESTDGMPAWSYCGAT